MRFLETKCKICGNLVAVKFGIEAFTIEESETLKEAVDKFLPLVTCDPCYDARDERQRASEMIYGACFELERVRPSQRTGRILDQARRQLEYACPKYGQAIAKQFRVPDNYHHSIVEVLIDKPEKCGAVLKQWRDERRKARQE